MTGYCYACGRSCEQDVNPTLKEVHNLSGGFTYVEAVCEHGHLNVIPILNDTYNAYAKGYHQWHNRLLRLCGFGRKW